MKNALRRNAIPLAEIALNAAFIALMITAAFAAFGELVLHIPTLVWVSTTVVLGMVILQAMTLRLVWRGQTPIEHLSLGMLVLAFGNAVNWSLFAITTGVHWVALPAIVLVPFALQVGLMIARTRGWRDHQNDVVPVAVMAELRQ